MLRGVLLVLAEVELSEVNDALLSRRVRSDELRVTGLLQVDDLELPCLLEDSLRGPRRFLRLPPLRSEEVATLDAMLDAGLDGSFLVLLVLTGFFEDVLFVGSVDVVEAVSELRRCRGLGRRESGGAAPSSWERSVPAA
ncbi:hypothetical protein MTO96_047716 [Rhipicephalus appendiculatus]